MKKCTLLSLCLLLIGNICVASGADQLIRTLADLKSMQASFEQTVLDNQGSTLMQSRGNMFLQRPGKFRWDTQSPSKQYLIADGKYLWVYDVDLQQVTRKKQAHSTQISPAMLLSDSPESLSQHFVVTEIHKANATGHWYKLEPKDTNNLFHSISLHFNENNTLQEMDVVSSLGQRSMLRFYQVVANPQLSANLFYFKLPQGVDVIYD